MQQNTPRRMLQQGPRPSPVSDQRQCYSPIRRAECSNQMPLTPVRATLAMFAPLRCARASWTYLADTYVYFQHQSSEGGVQEPRCVDEPRWIWVKRA